MSKKFSRIEEPTPATQIATAKKTFKKVSEFWNPQPGDTLVGYLMTRVTGLKKKEDGTEYRYDLACFDIATDTGERTGEHLKLNIGAVLRNKLAAIDPQGKLLMIEYTGELPARPGQNPARMFELYVAEGE